MSGKQYEANILLKSSISDEALEKNISQIEDFIKSNGGKLIKVEDPIRRKLTHPIKSSKDGNYVNFIFNSPTDTPNLLKRNLAISDDVLRYMVIKKDS